jgi:hypothetical protein
MKMANKNLFRGVLHRTTHRIPGVPAHAERPAGHQGTAIRGLAPQPSPQHTRNHSPARAPRFMPAWQRRVAALFGREL